MVNKLEITTPYMLRNDGELFTCGDIHPYIKMSNSSSFETNLKTLNNHPEFLGWFYTHTNNKEVKDLIDKFKTDKSEEIMDRLNDLTNQEFCRVRTSNYKIKYGGDNGQIYFRICSENFNWFDLIWNIVNNFSKQIKEVTVMKDRQSLGGKEFTYYYNHMPIEEFLTLKGNPIVEDFEDESKSEKIKDFIEDLYDLRKASIAKDGEYGLGNLVFKEFRNLGYLDNLKELRKQEKSKELSLEKLEEKLVTPSETLLNYFEENLSNIGFILDDETSVYGSKNFYPSHHGNYENVHYQIITTDKYDENTWEDKIDDLNMLLDDMEDAFDCVITVNAGLANDGRICAGLDIRDCWEADAGTDEVAPSKPDKLTFKNGKLEDTENNKYVIQDIEANSSFTKDEIEKSAPTDKKSK